MKLICYILSIVIKTITWIVWIRFILIKFWGGIMKTVFTKFLLRVMMLCVFIGLCNFDIVNVDAITEKSII